MDPLSQATVAAIAAQCAAKPKRQKLAALAGACGGVAPDLDVLIQSAQDPLLGLMLHRHFTHSFLFIPAGGLIVALAVWGLARLFKKPVPFKLTAVFTTLGFATHGLLDAATSYGTVLGWPFTSTRFAWDLIAIIDLAFTLPLLALVVLGVVYKNRGFAIAGAFYALLYLSVLAGNQYGARQVYLTQIPPQAAQTARVMPALFRPFEYRAVYKHEGRIYISTLHAPLFGDIAIKHAGSVEAVTLSDLKKQINVTPELARAFKDYSWFSGGYVGRYGGEPLIFADYRYGNFGSPLSPLWGVRVDEGTQKASPLSLRTKIPPPEEKR